MEAHMFLLICCIAGIGFFLVGVRARYVKEPVAFWSDSKKLDAEQFTDISAFNKANSLMWMVYGIPFILAGILQDSGYFIASMLVLLLVAGPGTISLLGIYIRVEGKYRIKEEEAPPEARWKV